MKGYIGVDIPTKKYLRAYIIAQLGELPVMSTDTVIGNKLLDLLQHHTNQRKKEFGNHYNAKVRIYIGQYLYHQRGCNLNETNIKNFNLFVQHLVKDKMRFLLDHYVPLYGSLDAGIEKMRAILGIGEEDWDEYSIEKDYLRYRKANNAQLLYKKTSEKTLGDASFLKTG